MNFALLLGAGAGLTWLTRDPSNNTSSTVESPDEDEYQPLRVIVGQVIRNPKTNRVQSRAPLFKDHPHIKHSTRGEGIDDDEEIEGDGYVNPKREFKGITTDLVNTSFLSRKEDVFRFLRLVIDTHVEAINLYADQKGLKRKQIRFVYKGGNVLRIVASEFLIELPGHASDLINDFYMPFFKRSDADFSIYVDPKLKNFDEVQEELTQLTWLLQQHIRERIVSAPHRFFEFFRLNRKAQISILEKYLTSLNKAETLDNPKNEQFYGGEIEGVRFENLSAGENVWGDSREPDTFISFADASKESTVTFVPRPNKKHYMRIQHNTALEFGEANEMASFNLVRTKIVFAVRFKDEASKAHSLRFGGELIDVSILKQKDSSLAHFFKTPNAVDRYELKHGEESLRFYGYSITYLIDDLDLVLFIRHTKPWDDQKYEKRLNRLFYLCFVETFITFGSNTERRNFLRDFCERIATKAYEPDLKKRTDRFVAKWKDKGPTGFNQLASRIADTAVPSTDEAYADYRDFVELVQRNCITQLTAFKNIGQFCTKGSALSEQRIYEGDFDALLPGE